MDFSHSVSAIVSSLSYLAFVFCETSSSFINIHTQTHRTAMSRYRYFLRSECLPASDRCASSPEETSEIHESLVDRSSRTASCIGRLRSAINRIVKIRMKKKKMIHLLLMILSNLEVSWRYALILSPP